jgi:flagellar biosynthetic protein FliR
LFLDQIVTNANLFFLILVRVFAMLAVAPLFSSEAVPDIVKVGLSFFTAIVIFPWVQAAGYPIPENGLAYVGLLVGEVLLGLLQGFFLTMVYSVFQMAGQYIAQQMGFSASEVYDPLAQVEQPVMGQFLNLSAMLVFLTAGGFQQVFLTNVWASFHALRAVDFFTHPDFISHQLIASLADLFGRSFLLSLPVFGVLFLTTISLGIVGKAAPQMNLMMMGFPINIGFGFILLMASMPFLVQAFSAVVNDGFDTLRELFRQLSSGQATAVVR